MSGEVGMVLLAAGPSTRLGRPKQLLRFKDESFIRRSVHAGLDAQCHPVLVVLGASELPIRKEIRDLPVSTVFNPQWQEGMGSSIAAGCTSLLQNYPHLEAILLMLCDQPLLGHRHICKLKNSFQELPQGLHATSYEGKGGVPALFGKDYFQALCSLNGPQGARNIIANSPEAILIESDAPLLDIDTEDDYLEFIRAYEKETIKRPFL